MSHTKAWCAVFCALLAGCQQGDPGAPARQQGRALPLKEGQIRVVIAYGSEKKSWLSEQVRRFEATRPKTSGGKEITIEALPMGSGEAMQGIVSGALRPHVFSPASGVYLTWLNSAWAGKTGRARPLAPQGEPLVLSPVVVALWQPMAEALGWPGKALGWSDLLAVSASPEGWKAYGRPEWGRFKMGHTHPEYSNSGLLSVLAEAYAGARKMRGLTEQDLAAEGTRRHLEAVEQTMVYYGQSTGFFADKMLSRGPSYLSAAVLYENLVIEARGQPSDPKLVAIYPREGTFWSDHPYATLDAEWVGPDEREGARMFLGFLKERPQQERAMDLGFRPADPKIALRSPVDAAHGVDPRQPQALLEVPEGPVIDRLLATFKEVKKSSDVILVFDKSGSMDGSPLQQARRGARVFLDSLDRRDDATLLFFDSTIYPPVGPRRMADGRSDLVSRVESVNAGGGTSLYDATARAYAMALERARKEPARIHAVVVMTDGKDEGSRAGLPELLAGFAREEAPVKVFTIAYGKGADRKVLDSIAEAARGASAAGGADEIVGLYREMGSFF